MEKFYKDTIKYYGLDLSNQQLNIAKKKVKGNNVEFICCSAEKIPLKNDSLEDNGFDCYSKFETEFKFDNKIQAQNIFSNIWGNQIGNKVSNKIIKQNIIIYKSEKEV